MDLVVCRAFLSSRKLRPIPPSDLCSPGKVKKMKRGGAGAEPERFETGGEFVTGNVCGTGGFEPSSPEHEKGPAVRCL
jgi:hypothetical protein